MMTTAATTTATSLIDPDGLNNTLVAESDFNAARLALVNFAAERKSKNRNNDNGDTLSRTHAIVAQSLLDHLQAAVRPVTDECFHMYCYELQKQQQQEEYPASSNDENETKTTAAGKVGNDDDNDDNVNTDDDWEEMVNQPLLERVRNLRQQVRDQAVCVGQVRDEVLQQAVALARRRCCENATASGINGNMSLDYDVSSLATTNNTTSNAAMYEQKVLEMQAAMQKMTQTLTLVETRLPESVRQWQETLDTLENETAPYYSQTSQHALSQTEQAIMEREDEDDDDNNDDMDDDNSNNNNNHRHPATAEERLSRFLSNNMLA